jgi:hypothetical protein
VISLAELGMPLNAGGIGLDDIADFPKATLRATVFYGLSRLPGVRQQDRRDACLRDWWSA